MKTIHVQSDKNQTNRILKNFNDDIEFKKGSRIGLRSLVMKLRDQRFVIDATNDTIQFKLKDADPFVDATMVHGVYHKNELPDVITRALRRAIKAINIGDVNQGFLWKVNYDTDGKLALEFNRAPAARYPRIDGHNVTETIDATTNAHIYTKSASNIWKGWTQSRNNYIRGAGYARAHYRTRESDGNHSTFIWGLFPADIEPQDLGNDATAIIGACEYGFYVDAASAANPFYQTIHNGAATATAAPAVDSDVLELQSNSGLMFFKIAGTQARNVEFDVMTKFRLIAFLKNQNDRYDTTQWYYDPENAVNLDENLGANSSIVTIQFPSVDAAQSFGFERVDYKSANLREGDIIAEEEIVQLKQPNAFLPPHPI